MRNGFAEIRRMGRQNRVRALLFALLLVNFAALPAIGLAQPANRTFERAGSPYRIADDMIVPFGEVWRVEAGVDFCFEAGIALHVDGVLVAQGTADRPVTFAACEQEKPWGGIRFVDSRQLGDTRSSLHHVVIEGARKTVDNPTGFSPDTAGGGLFVVKSDLDVFGTIVRDNTAAVGAGVYVGQGSDIIIERSAVYGNEALGSNYIYAGGGGIYFDGARRARVLRSVVALNRFSGQNYNNEEGGGGIYLANGPLELSFNLVIGNVAQKGPGMLVQAGFGTHEKRQFAANVFAYNSGALNLEQVALQTRYSFEDLRDSASWSSNSGQMPFVAHLNRNTLFSYNFKGSRQFLQELSVDGAGAFVEEIKDRARATAFLGIQGALSEVSLCGAAFDYGPIEICGGEVQDLSDYLGLVGKLYAPELRERLLKVFGPVPVKALTEADRERLAPLIEIARAPRASGELPPAPLDPRIIDLIFGSLEQRATAIEAIAAAGNSAPRRGIHTPLLIVHALGAQEAFIDLLALTEPSRDLLTSAVQARNEEAAFVLLSDPGWRSVFSIKELHELLQVAAANNQTVIIEELLDYGISPNLPLNDQLPLHLAVSESHLDAVQFLLRRGADPNLRVAHYTGSETLPALGFALSWFHLGSGHHEIAELLLAAGGELSASDLLSGRRLPLLRLQSAVQLGAVSPEDAAEIAVDYDTTSEMDRSLRQRLIDQASTVLPIMMSIRNLRNQLDADLAQLMADVAASPEDRAAASRVLSVRNFDLEPVIREDLLAAYRSNESGPRHTQLSSFQRVTRYRTAHMAVKGVGEQSPLVELPRAEASEALLPYGRKLALVVGISDYKDLPARDAAKLWHGGEFDLAFAEADAEAVAGLLESPRMGSGWEIELLTGTRANRAELERIMTLWQHEATAEDLVLFFFSGHGFPGVGEIDRTFLFLQDSQRGSLDDTALSLAVLRDWVLGLKARHVLVLLDACRSGTIASAKGSGGIEYAELEHLRVSQAAGKVALTSSLGGQLSYEWHKRGLGFFTAALVDAINGRIPTYARGKLLSLMELYQTISKYVVDSSTSDPLSGVQMPDYSLLDGSDLLQFPIAVVY